LESDKKKRTRTDRKTTDSRKGLCKKKRIGWLLLLSISGQSQQRSSLIKKDRLLSAVKRGKGGTDRGPKNRKGRVPALHLLKITSLKGYTQTTVLQNKKGTKKKKICSFPRQRKLGDERPVKRESNYLHDVFHREEGFK